jgi:P-type conjugative transfer protein TrbJ
MITQLQTTNKTMTLTALLSRLPSPSIKSGKRSPQNGKLSLAAMSALFLAAVLNSNLVAAGSVAGTGGGTEITQIMNNIQLVNSYQQQVQQFVKQGLQYEAQLKNMEKNPTSSMANDMQNMINNIGRTMSAGQSMGGSLAQIDRNFASRYNNPSAATYSQNFSTWTTTSKDTLQGSMMAAGLRRDQYQSDSAALSALYDESQATGGNVAAIQTLSKINIKQVEQMQGLSELMATQNIASSTYMASQTANEQGKVELTRKIMGTGTEPRVQRTKNYLD